MKSYMTYKLISTIAYKQLYKHRFLKIDIDFSSDKTRYIFLLL